jgi:N-methylhydantoinase A
MQLDRDLSMRALEPIARHLDVGVVAAAAAVIRLVEANMINALKLVTIQRGHDPRDLTMVASGGGGPMHAATLARELGVKRTVVPRYAGLFSAWGMLAARPRLDLSQTRFSQADANTLDLTRTVFAELEAEAARYFEGVRDAMIFDRKIEMRYAGQEHTVAAPYDPAMRSVDELLEVFHVTHEKAYTFRLPDAGVELVTFQLGAELDTARVGLPDLAVKTTMAEALIGRRELYLGEAVGMRRADVYDRDRLPPGATLRGPVLIEEPTTTTLVLPGQNASIDRFGLLLIEEAA